MPKLLTGERSSQRGRGIGVRIIHLTRSGLRRPGENLLLLKIEILVAVMENWKGMLGRLFWILYVLIVSGVYAVVYIFGPEKCKQDQ